MCMVGHSTAHFPSANRVPLGCQPPLVTRFWSGEFIGIMRLMLHLSHWYTSRWLIVNSKYFQPKHVDFFVVFFCWWIYNPLSWENQLGARDLSSGLNLHLSSRNEEHTFYGMGLAGDLARTWAGWGCRFATLVSWHDSLKSFDMIS